MRLGKRLNRHIITPLFPCLWAAFPVLGTAADHTHTDTLEDVTVTARAISERSLDVPLSVHVLRGSDMRKRSMVSVEDGLRSVPGVKIHSGGNVGNSYVWIRGTGPLTHTSLDDNSVSIRVDGESLGIVGLAHNLYDIQKIEIAKRPQGTLYGSGAEAGLVDFKAAVRNITLVLIFRQAWVQAS